MVPPSIIRPCRKDMRVFDSRQIEGTANDVSRRQYASALKKLETGVKNYWLELCTKCGKLYV